MKAVRIHEHGDINVLKWENRPKLEILAGNVLVDIKATSLNHLDIWVRKGIAGVPLPLTTGSDGSGIISEVGDGVPKNRLGEKVLIQPLVFCGECTYCNKGKENYCISMGIMGENCQGVNAEQIIIPESQVVQFPDRLTFEEAASFALVAQTSYQMLVNRANLESGETVLVWGASSGVGSMGIQIAKALGATVIAVAGTEEKCEKSISIGADYSLNYTDTDILNEVKSITKGTGVDVVFEHVGQATWDISMKCLARGGRLVTCGSTTGFKANLNLTHLFFKQQSILGSTMGSKTAFDGAMTLLNEGKINPVVNRIFPITEIQSAHDYLESGKQFGKVVLSYD
ncbi:MAG: zinc-binding dehydrogenase [Candidatus Marinimicrobia bacterium]|jgi:NADPH2:quinone reductase|nr:zinc-binding dehydrogenase [Candidatus Neomarinimicrobiota bacterium]MBT3502779.1 zinc-binding dehydrogenase [Candidatus Neomarinimicrobiota bacterium]MBT3839317.1 zinc-binding dehydrogenase [Candidatus Neomarinimicrobiota bacterium]MBT3999072.1 zinc-binding dehydrogenase [Candidatus Neomarinimicrobiota bacterium]MBT4282359.1 zinc-binding dehydrogenase [Candidatus Neomarinimicrobiota bacterium]